MEYNKAYAFALSESTIDVLFSEYRHVIKNGQVSCADAIEDEIKRRFEALEERRDRVCI